MQSIYTHLCLRFVFESDPIHRKFVHSEIELFELIIRIHVLQMMLILCIPVDIAPGPIASDLGLDVAMVAHIPCTFRIADDQNK